MKRAIIAIILACAVLLTLAGTAEAKDYRPWKAAMSRWFDEYVQTTWIPQVEQARADGTFTSRWCLLEFPPGAEDPDVSGPMLRSRRWDPLSQSAATFITAIEGLPPNCGFNRELRAILRPYLLTQSPRGAVVMRARHHD